MTDHEIHTLAGAYALNALPDDEERFFEAHLGACDACRAEVAELRATAASLGSAAAAPAPPSLRSDVLAAIDVTRQDPAPTRLAAQRRRPLAVLSAAAALVILVAGFGVAIARLNAELEETRTRAAEVAAVLTADDAELITVTGSAGEQARIITSAEHGRTVFVGNDLQPVPSDKTLELWLINEDGAQPAGLFTPDEDGRAVHVVPRDLAGVDAVGVTVEPAGGSPQPTTDPFLLTDV